MIEERRFLYRRANVNNNTELDYIDTPITTMDISYTQEWRITGQYENRPDLISFKFYRSYDFAWLICDYNDILDPYDELEVGRKIKIPSLEEFYSFFNRRSIT